MNYGVGISRRAALRMGAAMPAGYMAAASPARVTGRKTLSIYRPRVHTTDIYTRHPGITPLLKYNHDADIVKFKGRYIAAWNANGTALENAPGQFNYSSVSDDFFHWSKPIRPFTREGGSENPVDKDNQWQPGFINYHDRILFCAWCTLTSRQTFVSSSLDGVHWLNSEVPTAPKSLKGKVVGFPTTHGLLTSKDVLMFPCSLPNVGDFIVGTTRYAAVLLSFDGGKHWEWSDPIEAMSWSETGEDPALFGGETIYLWEPVLFEKPDGGIGLLIRNSTAQDAPQRAEKPHRMILTAEADAQGRRWSKARPVEVDSICSRMFAVAQTRSASDLLAVMNDWYVRIPEKISYDRYFLSLFCSPVCDPDLLLPGPVVQPPGGRAFYPSGFTNSGRLYLAYTYPGGIQSSIIDPLPDFSEPFFLPREGRTGLRIEDRLARLGHRFSTLGLVMTAKLTAQPELRVSFEVNVNSYDGNPFPILTLGGKTRGGASVRVVYSQSDQADAIQAKSTEGEWLNVALVRVKEWNRIMVHIRPQGFAISVNGAAPRELSSPVLRKLAFGGLYERPEWPIGMTQASDIQINLDSVQVG
ncbi:MAG: sialidase family protein [Bryobacteraceae bacterium]